MAGIIQWRNAVNPMIENALSQASPKGAVQVYCLAAMVAEEARMAGCDDFAKNIEGAIEGLISGLPKTQQREALMLSFELALAAAGDPPRKPHLRLVYSRE